MGTFVPVPAREKLDTTLREESEGVRRRGRESWTFRPLSVPGLSGSQYKFVHEYDAAATPAKLEAFPNPARTKAQLPPGIGGWRNTNGKKSEKVREGNQVIGKIETLKAC